MGQPQRTALWTSSNFPPKTRTTAAAVVHSLFIPLFLSQFLPHSGSSWSPHKTVHSLRLLTGFHPFLSHPVCPKALSKLRLHGHIFSSLRSHPLPLCKAYIRNPLLYLLMNAVASRSVSGSFQLPLTEASPPHPPLSAPRTWSGGMLICVQMDHNQLRLVIQPDINGMGT